MLREDRARTSALIERLSAAAFETTGLGGGAWSPKDLVGHLETWERFAIEAIEAIERGEPAPIAQESLETDELNRREVERKAARTAAEIRSSASATHDRVLQTFAALDDERWVAPEAPGTDRTVADRLGSILGGSLGSFRHDPDHWDDIEAFVAEHASG